MTITDAFQGYTLERSLQARIPGVTEAPDSQRGALALSLVPASCSICGDVGVLPLGVSKDFTYHTSPDAWLPLRCLGCGSVFVSPTPASTILSRLYPAKFYSQPAGPSQTGLIGALQRRAAWRALRGLIGPLEHHLRIIDIGCGGGHYLRRLKQEGGDALSIEGVDPSPEAVEAARASGLTVHQTRVEDRTMPAGRYDVALLIHTLEHLSDPVAALTAVRSLLRPGGRALVVVYNLASPCFGLFQGRHWGGYDFPRQRALYSELGLRLLADRTGFELESAFTAADSACWPESAYRLLIDWCAPSWLARRFAPESFVAASLFAAWERVLCAAGRGGRRMVTLRRPARESIE